MLRRFVQGPGGEPIARYEGSGTSTRRYFHADERGSVIAVSDNSGNLVGSVNRYDEYGNPQGGAITGRFGYTGQMWLPEAGLYDYRARAYHPGRGRFMQTDPIGFGGGMNLYAYVGGDPVNSTDPSGTVPPSEMLTGSRLPARQDIGPGLCTGCSGMSTSSITGNLEPGSSVALGLFKVGEFDRGTKAPIRSWLDLRVGNAWGFAAQGSSTSNRILSSLSETWRDLLSDDDVRQQMAVAWGLSIGNGTTAGKNEYGFWITQFGSDFRAGEIISGYGPNIFNYVSRRPSRASIFFHTHPFFPGEIPRVTSLGISTDDQGPAFRNRFMIIAIARPHPGSREFLFFECDWRPGRGGC